MMKRLILGLIMILGLTSLMAFATEGQSVLSLEGKYSIMNPDSGLIVLMGINKSGKVEILERLIAAGIKAKCKKTKEVLLKDEILVIKADCKVRDGWENIGNKEERRLVFNLNLENLVNGNKLSEDEVSEQYEGSYSSEVTNQKYDVIINRMKH
jgi:hypothetical protein